MTDPDEFDSDSRTFERITRPDVSLAPSPARASKFEGWWTRLFLGSDERLYERRRRRGRNGVIERWFIVTKLTVTRHAAEDKQRSEPAASSDDRPFTKAEKREVDRQGLVYALSGMCDEIIEELDFATKESFLDANDQKTLRLFRRRIVEAERLTRDLIRRPKALPTPQFPAVPASVVQ